MRAENPREARLHDQCLFWLIFVPVAFLVAELILSGLIPLPVPRFDPGLLRQSVRAEAFPKQLEIISYVLLAACAPCAGILAAMAARRRTVDWRFSPVFVKAALLAQFGFAAWTVFHWCYQVRKIYP